MAIKDSDAADPSLSFENDIVPEFLASDSTAAGNRPHSLSEYYKEGGKVPTASPANDRIPLSGSISFHDFYGAVNLIEATIDLDDLGTYGRLNTDLYEKANSITGEGDLSDRSVAIGTPFVFTISSDFDQTQTAYNKFQVITFELETGGNFSNLTIINDGIIAGRGADAGTGSSYSSEARAGINVTHPMGSLTIINNNFIASGGRHGATRNGSLSADYNDNMTGSLRAGGGGGQGGGNGRASEFTASPPSTSQTANAGGRNLAGGSSSSGSSNSGSFGTHDRITGGSVSGGSGSAGGGNGGAASGAIQDNRNETNGREFALRGASGGGSSLTSVTGGSGSITVSPTSSSGGGLFGAWVGDHNAVVGQGGGAWATGTKSSIHGTSNASSYTLTNNGTIK